MIAHSWVDALLIVAVFAVAVSVVSFVAAFGLHAWRDRDWWRSLWRDVKRRDR